ncbi:MAG: sugar phosphate isomerase/epimerase family protein [Promethearchaeota archaeon]
MKLGISSLGHLVSIALKAKYKNFNELLMQSAEECLKYSEKKGLKVCEIIIDPPMIIKTENRKRFIDLCNSYSIEKQIHSNFVDVSLCSFNPWISKGTLDSYIENAKICEEIGAKIMTIHPGVSNLPVPSLKEGNTKILIKRVNELLDAVADFDVTICIENMPKETGMLLTQKEMEAFFSAVNRNDLFFTYDTSHLWTNDGDVESLWAKFHKIIKNVHFAENMNKETDTHPQIGVGKVNFQEIINIIKKYEYNGAMIIELLSSTSLRNSIKYINDLF